MKRNIVHILFIPAIFIWGSCVSGGYQIDNITRSRILIDTTYDYAADLAAAAFIAPYKAQVDSIMSPVVGEAGSYLWAERPESNLSDLLSDILVWAGKDYNETPDMGIYNMGGIRAAMSAGPVTYGDILEDAPFDNKNCFLSLSGSSVLKLFRQIAGTHGEGVSRGVKMEITPGGELLSARLNGEEIDQDRSYRVATIDFLAQGNDYLTAFLEKTDVVAPQDSADNMRFIIINYFKEKKAKGEVVDPKVEGRIIVKDAE